MDWFCGENILKIVTSVHKDKEPFKISHTILTKIGLGYVLGDFLTNSSGHPGAWANANLHFCLIFTRKNL
jgi:uncharacterized membrane-anchored protein